MRNAWTWKLRLRAWCSVVEMEKLNESTNVSLEMWNQVWVYSAELFLENTESMMKCVNICALKFRAWFRVKYAGMLNLVKLKYGCTKCWAGNLCSRVQNSAELSFMQKYLWICTKENEWNNLENPLHFSINSSLVYGLWVYLKLSLCEFSLCENIWCKLSLMRV